MIFSHLTFVPTAVFVSPSNLGDFTTTKIATHTLNLPRRNTDFFHQNDKSLCCGADNSEVNQITYILASTFQAQSTDIATDVGLSSSRLRFLHEDGRPPPAVLRLQARLLLQ